MWTPDNKTDRDAIRQQLERMLASPPFKNSKRYPGLFRFIVDAALDGRVEQLKERTLGVEFFGRDPDYDTNVDHVVRTTVGEIRKRIAQYYHEPIHRGELRIDLPVGTYVPEFHKAPEAPPAAEVPVASPARRAKLLLLAGAVAVAILAAALLVWKGLRPPPTALDRVWAPVLESPGPVVLCFGGRRGPGDQFVGSPPLATAGVEAPPGPSITVRDLHIQASRVVHLTDAITVARLAGYLESKSKPYRILTESSATLSDLRQGGAVLVGGFNNDWTLRLTNQMRFRFEMDAAGVSRIVDRQNPSRRDWTLDWTAPARKVSVDYAIVSRVLDPRTARIVVVAAGMGQWGTLAAGEFLTQPGFAEALAANAPPGWERKRLQAVIATNVINGESGPPRLIEAYFW